MRSTYNDGHQDERDHESQIFRRKRGPCIIPLSVPCRSTFVSLSGAQGIYTPMEKSISISMILPQRVHSIRHSGEETSQKLAIWHVPISARMTTSGPQCSSVCPVLGFTLKYGRPDLLSNAGSSASPSSSAFRSSIELFDLA